MFRRILLVVALLGWVTSRAEANVLLNGGFEAGSFADWLAVPDPVDSLFFVSGRPHSGTYAAWFGAIGNVDETISQTFATTPGDTYTIDFWLAHGRSFAGNDFNVTWTDAFDASDSLLSLLNTQTFDYTHYVLTHTATGASATIQFGGRDVMSYYYLDDVIITGSQVAAAVPVPEPATWLLVSVGFASLARKRRRTR